MQSINALSLTPDGNQWLANSRHPRILHVFDRACNLINERREVLSIVTPQIGNGPFTLVVEEDILFSNHLHDGSPVFIHADQVHLGDLIINIPGAKLWSPRPNWEKLHAHRDPILRQLIQLSVINYQPSLPTSLLSTFSTSIATADFPSSLAIAHKLSG